MAVKRNYRINLRNYGNPPAIMVSQYDENYDLVFEVYDGVVPATGLNAYTVKLVGRQPGEDPALKYEFTGTVSGMANNILSFTIDTTMTGSAGKGTAEIVILDTTNDVKFASFNLPVYVEKAAVPDDAIDADVERAQEIADEVQEIVDTAAAEVKGEAEAWAVGQRDGVDVPSTDPAYENNAKYYAEQAQEIADSIGIDATLSVAGKAADAKKVGDEISAIKEDLTFQLNGVMFLGSLVPNVYIATDGREVTYNGWSATKYLSLESVDTLTIHSNARSVYNAFYDSNKTFVSTFVVKNGETQVVIPNNAVYFRLSNITVAMQNTTVDGALADIFKTPEEITNIKSNLYIDDVARITHADAEDESYDLAYINTSGNTVEYANSYCSDYVSVVSGGTINYKLSYIHGLSVALAFYDEAKTFISGVKKDSGSSGAWTEISGNVVVPNNATYVRFSMLKINSGTLVASDQYVELPVKAEIGDIVDRLNTENTIWKNKKWCAFGTSITDTSFMNTETGEVTGKYVPYLAKMSGLVVTNRGIAGGTLGSGGVSGGTSTILNRILNSSDLDDYDLITVEGFVNDFACGVAIGAVGDTENTTMYGALFQAIEHILTTSHATVVFITETTGKYYEFHTTSGTGDYRVLRKNGIGLYQQDYNNAIIDICQRYGIPVIDAGAKSQINQYRPQFIIDQIHHTELGGKQYANTIWSELKNIPVLAKTNA